MFTTTQCPVCDGKTFTPFLTCIDHTVSHETFALVKCDSCRLIITSPRPDNGTLGKYYISDEYISHSNRSVTITDKAYKIARNIALSWKVNLVSKHVNGSKGNNLLDYGCGTGEFLKRAQQVGYNVTGVEPSDLARTQALELTNAPVAASVDEITTGPFDAITLWHVLEHVPDLNGVLEQLKTRLRENGTIFIAVPNHQSHDAKVYRELWAGYDVPRHLWHFSKENMKALFQKHNLKLSAIVPMKLDAFYVSMLSEKYKRNKISIAGLSKAFITGLQSNAKAASTSEYSSLIFIGKK
jgi:2-polyprenyl-3-methyl-5-hydroxy-6-metoxy-1,4-benzoquinol methylase